MHGPRRPVAACRRARRDRHAPQGRQAADPPARRRARSDGGRGAAHDQRSGRDRRDRRQGRARTPSALSQLRRPRRRLPVSRPASFPSQRLPPARVDLVRVSRDPEDGADLRRALDAARRLAPHGRAPRPDPRDRRDRLGQDDDARRDDRRDQPHPDAAHRHDRGPDRDPPRGRPVHRQPARGRPGHRVVRSGPPPRAPPGPRRDPDRRASRLRDRADGAPGRRVRTPRALHHAHGRRNRDGRPDDRVLPRGQAAADSLRHGRRALRRGQPAPGAEGRRRPHRCGRGDGEQRAHRRLDPRGQGRADRRGHGGRRVLRHADLHEVADRPRRLGDGRQGGRRERLDQPARLPRHARARRSSSRPPT